MIKGVTTTVRPTMAIQRPTAAGAGGLTPTMALQRPLTSAGGLTPTMVRTMTPKLVQPVATVSGSPFPGGVHRPGGIQTHVSGVVSASPAGLARVGALNSMTSSMSGGGVMPSGHPVREKKSSSSYSVTGDEDINDVA